MPKETLLEMVKRHEGLEKHPYMCSSGTLTIGYGRNLETVGISVGEARLMLMNDLERAKENIRELFPDFETFSKVRKNALTDMIFNLGRAGFLTFRKMITGILKNDWEQAAREAEDSKWFRQVGVRGTEIVSMLRNG